MDVTAIVMAAGEGTRMKSNHAKVSHKILGKPMACWVIDAALEAGCNRVVVVVGSHSDEVRGLIADAYEARRTRAPSSASSRPSAWAPAMPCAPHLRRPASTPDPSWC